MTLIAKAADAYETSDTSLLAACPLVSVIVLTYNHAPFLREAVSSVIGQIAPFPIEVVIAEDHSTDDTLQIALALQRENPATATVRVIHGPANIGGNRNVVRAIGALSLVAHDSAPFGIYAGIPMRRRKDWSRRLLEVEKRFLFEQEASHPASTMRQQ
jgi:glycosyltransferase involved in cell wall biosynthesis